MASTVARRAGWGRVRGHQILTRGPGFNLPTLATTEFFGAKASGTDYFQTAQATTMPAASLTRSVAAIRLASAAATASLGKAVAHALQATTGPAAKLMKALSRTLRASGASTASLVKSAGKLLQASGAALASLLWTSTAAVFSRLAHYIIGRRSDATITGQKSDTNINGSA